ncbi:DUF3575 domain-containing protein [Dyadobacter psychrotolerans]|uniref:DUF3575 domain-containing protein n=1 Tax=Dyadobacter psychrotolerans TaxID=2541721 RepID=A0A4R5DS13_9BACT|nr:DUF3575 domain-containing protein [Dyadobacter psychrotolerans]TDE17246.1 DUF3575 domain-containing protein [Dyadobacter psychrotolerans]
MKVFGFSFVLISLYFSLPGLAQTYVRQNANNVIVKFAPLAMFDIDNTFQAGIEIPINTRWTVQQDFGYGHANFNLWYIDRNERPDKTTWKSRTQIRYYFYQKNRFAAYLAGEYLYKRVVTQQTQWVGVDCGTGGCNYFENKNVKLARLANGMHVKAGWQFYFSNRTTIDLFTGFGLRNRQLRILTPNVDRADFGDDFGIFSNNTPGSSILLPSVAVGFHIGIMLGKINKEN